MSDTPQQPAEALANALDRLKDAEARVERLIKERQLLRQHEQQRLESDSPVSSCSCLTKSPDTQYHKPGCRYRLITERDEARKELAKLRERNAKITAEARSLNTIIKDAHNALQSSDDANFHDLAAPINTLREDKARLDWLSSEEGFCVIRSATARELHGKVVYIYRVPATDLRPVIDNARLPKKP